MEYENGKEEHLETTLLDNEDVEVEWRVRKADLSMKYVRYDSKERVSD